MAGSTCACTCHSVPLCEPGTAEAPAAEPIDGSVGATLAANVASGRMAMSAGGWAGAGPSSGLSGWKSASGAVTSAIPLTRNRIGVEPRRGVKVTMSPGCTCSVAASC